MHIWIDHGQKDSIFTSHQKMKIWCGSHNVSRHAISAVTIHRHALFWRSQYATLVISTVAICSYVVFRRSQHVPMNYFGDCNMLACTISKIATHSARYFDGRNMFPSTISLVITCWRILFWWSQYLGALFWFTILAVALFQRSCYLGGRNILAHYFGHRLVHTISAIAICWCALFRRSQQVNAH